MPDQRAMLKPNENTLKLLAAGAMFLDHLGAEVFPEQVILRVIGRLAFPIFSYYIYVGCLRTHNRWAYWRRVCLLGVFCMAVFYLFDDRIYGNTLITFSLSIGILCGMQKAKEKAVSSPARFLAGAAVCILCLVPVRGLTQIMEIDYGIWGVYVPVLAELFRLNGERHTGTRFSSKIRPEDVGFTAGLVGLACTFGGIQFFSLAAVPLLILFRNGKQTWRLPRYFFYYFYPLHFAVVYLIGMGIG